MTSEPIPTAPDSPNEATSAGAPVAFIGHGGEHGLGREMLCSLPRGIACRLCRGEHDCPFVAERPYGRLVVKRRTPESLIDTGAARPVTGIHNPSRSHTWWQPVVAIGAWIAIPIAMWFTWFVRPVSWADVARPALVLLTTFAMTVVGVPLVRMLWRDRGGRRQGGAWKPS
jgi:hypothetical protein